MKKINYTIVAIVLLIGMFTGCSRKEDNYVSFEAEILETGNRLLVAPDEESGEYKSSDKISVGIQKTEITDGKGEGLNPEELNVGDFIRIFYDGNIMLSYPAQINAAGIELMNNSN